MHAISFSFKLISPTIKPHHFYVSSTTTTTTTTAFFSRANRRWNPRGRSSRSSVPLRGKAAPQRSRARGPTKSGSTDAATAIRNSATSRHWAATKMPTKWSGPWRRTCRTTASTMRAPDPGWLLSTAPTISCKGPYSPTATAPLAFLLTMSAPIPLGLAHQAPSGPFSIRPHHRSSQRPRMLRGTSTMNQAWICLSNCDELIHHLLVLQLHYS